MGVCHLISNANYMVCFFFLLYEFIQNIEGRLGRVVRVFDYGAECRRYESHSGQDCKYLTVHQSVTHDGALPITRTRLCNFYRLLTVYRKKFGTSSYGEDARACECISAI